MSMTMKIKILLIKRNMLVKDLARELDCTSQNLSNKFRRDNFDYEELRRIADVLGCDFEAFFRMRDTGEKI